MKKDVLGVMAGIVQLGSIIGLAAIGLKRNNDCYKAQCELVDEQCKNIKLEIDMCYKDAQIKMLEKQLEEAKGKSEKEEA